MPRETYQNWSRLDAIKGAAKLSSMAEQAERQHGWRHRMAARGASVYGSCGYGDLFDGLYADLWHAPRTRSKRPMTKLKWNFAKAIARTLRAKLTGLDEPKTQMVATEATYEQRRRGRWHDRFIEGCQHLPSGTYQTAWDLARHGFLLGAHATGTVAARVEPDFVGKRVRAQLRSTMSTFVDPADVADGRPLTHIDITWENPEYLAEDPRWKKHADWIMQSAKPAPHMALRDDVDFRTPLVKVISAWRLPFGSFKGRHARVVGGKALFWEDWEFEEPPLAYFRIQRTLDGGFWSENFIEDAYDALFTANDVLRSIDEAIVRLSQTYLVQDTAGKVPNSAIANGLDVNLIKYDSSQGQHPPQVLQPPPINDAYWTVIREQIQAVHQILGVDQMHVGSQSPAGLDSGRALRLWASLFAERFADLQRGWRHWVAVDTAKLYVRAARQIGEIDPDWTVTWPGADFDARVGVEALDIDEDVYTMRPYVVSEQKNTPSDRAAAAQEMFDRGEITEEQLGLVLSGLYDTPGQQKGSGIQRRWVAKNVSLILDSEEEEVEDEAAFMGEVYMQPPPWIDPQAAITQALEAYLQADLDEVPQNRRRLLRRFLEDLDALQQQQSMQAQQAQALAGANVQVQASMGEAFGGAAAPEGGMNGSSEAVAGGAEGAVPGAGALAGLIGGGGPIGSA